MKILAIDLGKFKSMACVFEAVTGEHALASCPIPQLLPEMLHVTTHEDPL